MKLFEKMNKILRDNSKAESYSQYVIEDFKSVENKLEKWHEISHTLLTTRKKSETKNREELVYHLLRILDYIEGSLDTFEYDYIDLCQLIRINPDMNLKTKINEQVSYALSTKSELKKQFGIIYKNFQNMAKKLDDIPMKEILKRMREVFDFGGTKQYEEFEYVQKKYLANRYWDSTSMTFRPLR